MASTAGAGTGTPSAKVAEGSRADAAGLREGDRLAAIDGKVAGFAYASSSSVYGSSETLPKREGEEGGAHGQYTTMTCPVAVR